MGNYGSIAKSDRSTPSRKMFLNVNNDCSLTL